ncbi:MAG: peptidylprolyl isomerase [Chitinophagaceae bacterium]|nr:peptidylprolyl isomerase [Chitinophagaceae bacterium]
MKKLSTLLVAMLLVSAAFSQGVRKVTADKIVGIVGDKIILRSDVYNDILDRQRRGESVPPNANCYIMEQLLTLKALVLQAEKDSIIVGEDEIEALLDNQVRGFIQMYGGRAELEAIAGRSIYQIKEDFRQSFTERKKAERMKDKITEGVKITPQEVKEYYDKIPKDSLAFYESEVAICEVVLYPKPSRELELLAMDELAEYKKAAESGTQKFETLAQLYSEDPGSKESGGRYAINRTEKTWDPAFIQNAFRLKDGQISPVFKSKFGYHIIKMESRTGDDAIIRHILRIPKITDDEVNNAVNQLDSVRAKIIAGTMNFGEAVNKYSEDESSKFTGGCLQNQSGGGLLTMDQLDKDMVEFLAKANMKVGEVSKPNVFTEDRTKKKGVRLVFLKSRSEPHRENLKDDYDRVASRALEQKKDAVLEKWFQSKIPTFYMMIDDDFKGCETMSQWLQYAVKNTNN